MSGVEGFNGKRYVLHGQVLQVLLSICNLVFSDEAMGDERVYVGKCEHRMPKVAAVVHKRIGLLSEAKVSGQVKNIRLSLTAFSSPCSGGQLHC